MADEISLVPTFMELAIYFMLLRERTEALPYQKDYSNYCVYQPFGG